MYFERIWTPDVGMDDLERDFNNRYHASYDNFEAFLDDQLDIEDVLNDLTTILNGHRFQNDILNWIRTGLGEVIKHQYIYIPRDGMIHVYCAN